MVQQSSVVHTTRVRSQERQLLEDQVILFGHHFPIYGQVSRQSVTPFPPKTVIGDYQRQDLVVESEWIMRDFSGGIGVLDARPNEDNDRYSDGTIETRYRFPTLGNLVHKVVNVTIDGSTISGVLPGRLELMAEFTNLLFAAEGANVYQWDNVTRLWHRRYAGLTGTLQSICVHDGYLYILTSDNLWQYQALPNIWTSPTVPSPGYALTSFDDKLWLLDDANQMKWVQPNAGITGMIVDNSGGNLTLAGELLMPAGECQQLIPFFDQSGMPAIHAITRSGVLGYDPDTAKFYVTPLVHAPVPNAGKGACVWQGALYVPVGSSILKYTGNLVQTVGPDKDDGLPASQRGTIDCLVPSHTFMYAISNVTIIVDPESATVPLRMESLDTYASKIMLNLSDGAYNFQDVGQTTGAVYVTPGQAWHMLPYYQAEGDTTDPVPYGIMGCGVVAAADDKYRLWYSDDNGAYFINLDIGLHNPLRNPSTQYAKSGVLHTSRQDLQWAELPKQAVSFDAEVESATSTESITVQFFYDDQPADPDDLYTMTAPGSHAWTIDYPTGKRFNVVRAEIKMKRGDRITTTPVLRSATLGYMRVPNYLRGWTVLLDLTDPRCVEEIGLPAGDLIEKLFDLRAAGEGGTFTYRYPGLEPQTRHVWIHEVQGSDFVAAGGGKYSVALVELDH